MGAKGSGDIHISPDGKFLYASNRLKADGIAIFSINQEEGTLTKTGYQLTGIHPRNFIISGTDDTCWWPAETATPYKYLKEIPKQDY